MDTKSIATRLTLGSADRLKSRKLINELFSNGKAATAYPLRMLYLADESMQGLQAGFTVSSRNFKKAVDRNRIKRLMREAYRLQKRELAEAVSETHKGLAIFFIYTGKDMPDLNIISEKAAVLLSTVIKSIT